MNHDYAEQFDLVNRYLMGRLAAEESERFEEHLIDCPQCIDLLKTTREFKQGLRALTVQQVLNPGSYVSKGSRWSFLQQKAWTLAACCLLLVAALISILLFNQVRRLRFEADQANSASSEWQQRYEEQQQSALSSEQQHQEIERDLLGQVQRLKEDMGRAEKQHTGTASESHNWSQPGINLPIFVLNSIRGDRRNPSDANEIKLSRSPMTFVISLPLEEEASYKTYHVTILTDRRRFWESTGLKPDRFNALTIGFNSSFFRPGEYSLTVEGLPRKQDSGIIGNYPFRIIKH
ncbi:MAG TPA: zf-HC2 domain-containing protein [Blastocatellia bacterium]|nr:zf-HC2 domain-containing protein [Blastocatellia bacterium]